MKQQRMTKQKQLVLTIASDRCDHPTADQIYLEVRGVDEHISRGTVYRNLEQLSDSGKLLRVKVPGADRFDSRVYYHYHMFCTGCRKVFDAPIAYQFETDSLLSEKTEFVIERHRTIFEGLCPECGANNIGTI